MSARIQDTFDLPVSDECGCSDARMVTQESDSASRPDGIGDVGAVRHSHWVRRVLFLARFIYWTCKHRSTANAAWVCNYEGLWW